MNTRFLLMFMFLVNLTPLVYAPTGSEGDDSEKVPKLPKIGKVDRPEVPPIVDVPGLGSDWYHLGSRPSTSTSSMRLGGSKKTSTSKLRPSTPSSATSESISPTSSGRISLASLESGQSTPGLPRTRKKHSSLRKQTSSSSSCLSSEKPKKKKTGKGRRQLMSCGLLPKMSTAVLDEAAAREGVVVSLPPIGPHGVFTLDDADGFDELLLADTTGYTIETFKGWWLEYRRLLVSLRERLFSFREHCTNMLSSKGNEAEFLASCNEASALVSQSYHVPFDAAFRTVEEVFELYSFARQKYEEAIIHAEKLFMGNYIDLMQMKAHTFHPRHALPADGIAIGLMNHPCCMECSRRQERRVAHPNFLDEKALSFDDVCPRCGQSLLSLVYDEEMVFDPATFRPVKIRGKRDSSILGMAEAYNQADYFLSCIYMGVDFEAASLRGIASQAVAGSAKSLL